MARSKRSREHGRVREAASTRYATDEPTQPLTGVLLDSDVIIEILRGTKDVVAIAERFARDGVPTYCTAINWAEIFAGIRAGEEASAQAFFAAQGEVVLDGVTGRRAGVYLARFGRSHGVAIADALIASAASTTGLKLWTRNRKHYPMDDVAFV